MDDTQKDLETEFKIISIMQTITEELDDEGKRILRKIFSIDQSSRKSTKDRIRLRR